MSDLELMVGTIPITRRRFAANGALLALLLASPRGLGLLRPVAPAELVRSTFAPLVGTSFRMVGGGRADAVVLAAVKDLGPVRRPNDQLRFALHFRAPIGAPRTDGIRSFIHHRIAPVDLFVTATGPSGAMNTFVAIIDRLRQ
jgi:hypothetical protein